LCGWVGGGAESHAAGDAFLFEDSFEHGGFRSKLGWRGFGWSGLGWRGLWDFGGGFWGDFWEAFLFDAGWGVELSDDAGRFGDGVEAAGVGGGELEAVEQDSAVLEVDHVGGDGVDGFGDGDLDGDRVLEGAEVEDGALALERGVADDGVAVDAVGSVEALVEVAEDGGLEGDGLALQTVGADVAADGDLHGCSFRGGYPPPVVSTVDCGVCR